MEFAAGTAVFGGMAARAHEDPSKDPVIISESPNLNARVLAIDLMIAREIAGAKHV